MKGHKWRMFPAQVSVLDWLDRRKYSQLVVGYTPRRINRNRIRSKDRKRCLPGHMTIIQPDQQLDYKGGGDSPSSYHGGWIDEFSDCVYEEIACEDCAYSTADNTEACSGCGGVSLREGELFELDGGIEIIDSEPHK